MTEEKDNNSLPIHKRILILFLLPVTAVGIIISVLLIVYLSPPIKSFLSNQFEANLRLASDLGTKVCENHFNQLLDMRLEDNLELNNAYKKEALSQIKAIDGQMPNIHMLVVEDKKHIKMISTGLQMNLWQLPEGAGIHDKIIEKELGGQSVRFHARFFPFWNWYIVSFVYQKDFDVPISKANQIIYFSTLGLLISVFITLFFVFRKSIEKPLNQLISATNDVAKGKLLQVQDAPDNEIGQLVGFFNNMVDSLKRKSEEVNLLISQVKESEKRYKSLVELSPEAVLVYQNGVIKYINQAGVSIFGAANQSELLGKSFKDLIHPDCYNDVNIYFNSINKYRKTLPTLEVKYRKIVDEIFDVEMTGTYIEYSGKPAILTVVRDITERKQADRAIQENEKQLQAIFEANPDPVIVYDTEGIPKYLNPAFINLFGWTLDDLRGRQVPFVPDDEKQITALKIREIYNTKKTVRFQTKRLTKSGETIDFYVSAAIISGDEGQPTGMVVNLTDITEQKKMKVQFERAQKMEAIGTLAGGIAHDFNNILSAIIGYTELSLYDDVDIDSPVRNNLDNVLKASLRAKDLVNQILTFSRQSEPELKPVEINFIIKEVTKLLRSSLPSTISIKQNKKSNSLVLGDPTQLHQILMNLCTNAGHAMREKGGSLNIESRSVKLNESLINDQIELPPGLYVLLTISDTGHGIPTKDINRIFDPFFTTKERGEGTGMGLSVVHGIVQSYKGAINVYSEAGKGTTFNIYLPAIESRVEPGRRDAGEFPKGNEHILIVDDEPSIVEMVTSQLHLLGYKVTSRYNSREALELFKAKLDSFDLVITDMTMPKMTGDELAREIKRISPKTPIIMCTGFSEKLAATSDVLTDFDAVLMKPIIIHEMAKAVRDVIDKDKEYI